MGLQDTLSISSAGMQVQSERLRVVAENIANAGSTAATPEGIPYRRKLVTFRNMLDRETGVSLVRIGKRTHDTSDFIPKFEPTHPAANEQGYVLYPNVNPIIEAMDMREARRAYEANLNVIEMSKAMLSQTINLLRA